MIHLCFPLPKDIVVACSGGVDSMVAVDFLLNGNKNVTVAHFDHGTEHGKLAREFVKDFCYKKGIHFDSAEIDREKNNDESLEEYWRNVRLKYLHSFKSTVITAHQLDDVMEWWIFSSLNGNSRLIPHKNRNILRPFLLTPKKELEDWAARKDVPFIADPSNNNIRFARNRIRHCIMSEALKINPGLGTLLKKKIKLQIKRDDASPLSRDRPVC